MTAKHRRFSILYAIWEAAATLGFMYAQTDLPLPRAYGTHRFEPAFAEVVGNVWSFQLKLYRVFRVVRGLESLSLVTSTRTKPRLRRRGESTRRSFRKRQQSSTVATGRRFECPMPDADSLRAIAPSPGIVRVDKAGLPPLQSRVAGDSVVIIGGNQWQFLT